MRKHYSTKIACRVIVWMFACTSGVNAAIPYVPISPNTIVSKLPQTITDGGTKLQAENNNTTKARNQALEHIAYAQRSGDARYFGYALGILKRWQHGDTLPDELLVPMAMAQQALHRFDAALDTLKPHLNRHPEDAQAWLIRAGIEQVQGRYAAARRSCEQLLGRSTTLVEISCAAWTERYTANAQMAYQALRSAVRHATTTDDSVLNWSLILLAELAEINADYDYAEQVLRWVIERAGDDIRPLTALADLQLRRGHTQALLAMIEPDHPSPALRMRRMLALIQQGTLSSDQQLAWLRQHFDAGNRRERPLHQRDAAIANLYLFNEPHKAFEQALGNWQQQREFADVEILLSTALAIGDRTRIQDALAWLDEIQFTDPRINPLRQALFEERGDAS
ncbi:MAG: hypothetical protein AB2629_19825 [Candidatus Thiodiazotropha sp.]